MTRITSLLKVNSIQLCNTITNKSLYINLEGLLK